jgi:general secretion pathway protein G
MNRERRRVRREAGITLIEMLVVVTIIGLFAALVAPRMFNQVDKARITQAHVQIRNLLGAAGQYKLETGNFPTTEQGLQALRPYLQQDVPMDPWGHPYVYKYPGEHGDEPDIISYGADGQPGGDGNNADIVSWKN